MLYRLNQSTDYTRECLSDTRHEISGFFDVVTVDYEALEKLVFALHRYRIMLAPMERHEGLSVCQCWPDVRAIVDAAVKGDT